MLHTYFAPAERTAANDLAAEIEIISKNPVTTGLLHCVSGLLAILDENRQIVAVNDTFLQMMGITDPAETLGLRQGEALLCVHAHKEPSGCGTTKFCSSCGAAIAIVSSLEHNIPMEKICALTAQRKGKHVDMALLVRSQPLTIDNKRFLLLFLQDITRQQQRAALERTFFHDINNMLTMLLGASQLLIKKHPSGLATTVHDAAFRLHKEIAIQHCLSQNDSYTFQPSRHEITTGEIVKELQTFFLNHPVARAKSIEISENCTETTLTTDASLLSRVLCNMVINALEATPVEGTVKVWIERKENALSFCVWNAQEIPQEIANRIFQRNFSTKEQAGRGTGTFSMKLFGEKILGGKVHFTTSRTQGTVFTVTLPV
jgi:signal transduction histidine kinase